MYARIRMPRQGQRGESTSTMSLQIDHDRRNRMGVIGTRSVLRGGVHREVRRSRIFFFFSAKQYGPRSRMHNFSFDRYM